MSGSSNSPKANSLTSAAAVWSFFVVVLPLATVLALDRHKWDALELLPLVTIVYAASRLASLQRGGTAKIVTVCVWVFVYIFFGLVPLLQMLAGAGFPFRGQFYSPADVLRGYSAVLIGLAAFDFGGWFSTRRIVAGHRPVAEALFSRRLSRGRIYTTTLVGIFLTTEMIIAVGGLQSLLVARMERLQNIASVAGGEGQAMLEIWDALLRTPSAAAFLCLLAFRGGGRRLRFIGTVLLVVAGAFLALISNPVNASRNWAGTVFLAIMFIVVRWNNKRSVALVSIALATMFVVVFPFADTFRYSLNANMTDRMAGGGNMMTVLTTKDDFDAMQNMFSTVEYVRTEGFTYGSQLMGSMLFWVPRSVWPDKPQPTPALLATYEGYFFKNISTPLWAEMYIDGGPLLVCLFFFLYGIFINGLEARYLFDRNIEAATLATVFVPVFAPYQFYLLRGSLMAAVSGLIPMCIFLLAATGRPCTTSEEMLATSRLFGTHFRNRGSDGFAVAGKRYQSAANSGYTVRR